MIQSEFLCSTCICLQKYSVNSWYFFQDGKGAKEEKETKGKGGKEEKDTKGGKKGKLHFELT